MKLKRKSILIAVSGILFFLVYMCFAGLPLKKEFQLEPQWVRDITNLSEPVGGASVSGSALLIPYKQGQNMGYFTPDGKIVSLTTFPESAAISKNYSATYSDNAVNTEFYKNTGERAGVIAGAGFPFFDDDRIFLFYPGGASLSQCRNDGSIQWTYDGYVPITAFDSSPNGTVVGSADGVIRIFSSAGKLLNTIVPGGSNTPGIFGVALSDSGTLVASISGISPQYFMLTRTENDLNKVVFRETFAVGSHEQLLVQFNSDGDMVFFAHAGNFSIFDCAANKVTSIPIEGTVLSVKEIENKHITAVLSRTGSMYTVHILQNFTTLVGSFSFEAKTAFIRTSPDSLYLGKDMTISKIAVAIR